MTKFFQEALIFLRSNDLAAVRLSGVGIMRVRGVPKAPGQTSAFPGFQERRLKALDVSCEASRHHSGQWSFLEHGVAREKHEVMAPSRRQLQQGFHGADVPFVLQERVEELMLPPAFIADGPVPSRLRTKIQPP